MTFLEKHDYDKTCMDSKRKRHKHMIGTIKKTARNTQKTQKQNHYHKSRIKVSSKSIFFFAHNHNSRYHMIWVELNIDTLKLLNTTLYEKINNNLRIKECLKTKETKLKPQDNKLKTEMESRKLKESSMES